MPPAVGAGEKHVTKCYRHFPEKNLSQLKVGHILYMYFQNERSVAKTIHAFAQRFNPLRCTPHHIRRVTVDVLKRFKHLSRQKEMASFAKICKESFTSYSVIGLDLDESELTASRSGENEVSHQDVQEIVRGPNVHHQDIQEIVPGPSVHHQDIQEALPGSSVHQNIQETVPGPIVQRSPSIPPETLPEQTITGSPLITIISTNPCCSRDNTTLTPRGHKLQKRLHFVSKLRSDMKNRYMKAVKNLQLPT